jgi:hypothetical protein
MTSLGPVFDSLWEWIFQDLAVFVVSVVGEHVPVDDEVTGALSSTPLGSEFFRI